MVYKEVHLKTVADLVNADIDAAAAIAKSKIATSGTWGVAEIPDLPASIITSAILSVGRGGLGKALSPTWTNDFVIVYKSGTDQFEMQALGSPSAHDILSASHGDALVGAVVAGDIIIGNATPKWSRLAKGTNGQVLMLVAGLPAWGDAGAGDMLKASYATASATKVDTALNAEKLDGSTKAQVQNHTPANHGNEVHSSTFVTASEIATHAGLTTGVHGVGGGTVAKVADIATDGNLSSAAQDAISKKHAANADTDLDATFEATFEKVANKGAVSGYAPLDAGQLVPLANIPATLTGKSADQVDACHAGVAANNVFKILAAIASGDIFYVDATPNITRLAKGTDGQVLKLVSGFPAWQTEGGGTAHDILSATHTDALAATVLRGALMIGNSTPKWSLLTIGTVGKVIRSDGTDPSWAQLAHTDLSAIGTNTHAQLDTFVASKGAASGLCDLDAGTKVAAAKMPTGKIKTIITFAVTGTLTTGTDKAPTISVPPGTLAISKVKVVVKTAPTGATLIVDVNKNGTTIFTTQANRPTIAISGTQADSGTPDVTTVAENDKITIDIDQIGSTVAGADLTVEMVCDQTVTFS